MAKIIKNKITFTENLSKEDLGQILLRVLRSPGEFNSIPDLQQACSCGQVSFDFNSLIPVPDETDIDYCLREWGTQENAKETEVDLENQTICFTTKWTAPIQIIYAFHKSFPDVDFEWVYASEEVGQTTGVVFVENGELITEIEPEDHSSEALENYISCWGMSDCFYRDDSGDWHRYTCESCPHPC